MIVDSVASETDATERFAFIGRLTRNRRVLSLADQALMSVVNMATSVIVGRTCPKAELGLYASGLSLVLFVTAVQSALISVPYTISSPRIKGEAHRVYKGSTFLQQAILVSVGMLVFFVLAVLRHSDAQKRDLQQVFLTLAVVSGMMCFRDFARRVSYAELQFASAITLDAMVATIQLGGVVALALTGKLSAARALGVVGIAAGAGGAVWLSKNWSSLVFSWKHSVRDFHQNWAFGRWLLSSSVLWSVCIEQYPWMLTAFRGATETATWAACYGVMSFLNPVVLAVSNDAAPRVANDYAAGGVAGLRKSVYRSAGIALLITLPIVSALLAFGGKLVKLMYGQRYTGVGPIVALLTLGFWLYSFSLVFPFGTLALKRPAVDFATNVICFIAFLSVGLWLIRTYGVLGAASSFLMVQIVALITRVIGFRLASRTASVAAKV